ncbi:MAG: MurR/RpiR family transcriptional regulator [Hyphomonadaceae bacterium]|nr:MurR/RpiR family transcriptional regulator [Hyphomonadaceae bacterium]
MAQASVETKVHSAMARFTSAEARAARALLGDYPTLGLAPVAEFATRSRTSAATVLRFVAQLGYASYPDFQRRLREELSERIKTPLEKTPASTSKRCGAFLPRFTAKLVENLNDTVMRVPQAEFEAVCALIADRRRNLHVVGGRFTDSVAAYLAAHLRIVRPGVRKLEERPASRADQQLDIGARDTVVMFDIRRYDPDLERFAAAARKRRATVVLLTDIWISPVARHARHVLPCAIETGSTWDSSAVLFAMCEAMIARATEADWNAAKSRIESAEGVSPTSGDAKSKKRLSARSRGRS